MQYGILRCRSRHKSTLAVDDRDGSCLCDSGLRFNLEARQSFLRLELTLLSSTISISGNDILVLHLCHPPSGLLGTTSAAPFPHSCLTLPSHFPVTHAQTLFNSLPAKNPKKEDNSSLRPHALRIVAFRITSGDSTPTALPAIDYAPASEPRGLAILLNEDCDEST
jgi:hypothetical protein